MKSLMRALDRFCGKHPRFGIPNLMIYIVAGNALVWLISMMDRTGTFLSFLAFHPGLILQGQVWRLITFVFIPTDSGILWVALMLYFYYFIGSTLERTWGSGKFTIFYFSGVLLTILFGFVVSAFYGFAVYFPLDAEYINMSMFFAFAALYPETMVRLFFFIPIKIKWLAWADAAFFIYEIAVNPFPVNLLPVAAFLNFALFCAADVIEPLRRRPTKSAVHFRREAEAARRTESARAYHHRCEVCGRTDTEHPELEFRYCSRCSGYHCYCSDHIYRHTHHTE